MNLECSEGLPLRFFDRNAWFRLGLLLVLASLPALTVTGQDSQTWVVMDDATLYATTKTVSGDILIRSGATLRVLGSELGVGGKIEVERNASLEIGSADGRATHLYPLNKSRGFWIEVMGTIRSGGLPPALIEGFSGDGLTTAIVADGGLQVHGFGLLENFTVRNGTAGITVQRTGHLIMRHGVVQQLGFVGVSGHGPLEVENVTIWGHAIGLTGRHTCNIAIKSSLISSFGDNVLVNSCPINVDSTVLLGGGASFTANGNAAVNITRSEFRDYRVSGLTVAPLPDETGRVRRPWLRVSDAKFVGAVGAKWGLELASASSDLRRLTVQGHAENGIKMYGGSLFLVDSSFENNGGYGVRVEDGEFAQHGNSFGSVEESTTNGLGPVSSLYQFSAQAVAPNGTSVPGLSVEVFDRAMRPIFELAEEVNESIIVSFESYGTTANGSPEYLGPFTFRATHRGRQNAMEGEIPGPTYDLYVDLDFPDKDTSVTGWVILVLFAATVSLIVYAAAGDWVIAKLKHLRYR